MATSYPIKPDAARIDIARLQWANAVMRAANRALAHCDVVALADMGFSIQHVDELRQRGGFGEKEFRANYQTISYLRRRRDRHAR